MPGKKSITIQFGYAFFLFCCKPVFLPCDLEILTCVQAFVAFIRKRDPRGKSPSAEREQKQQDMAVKVKEQAARARAAHRERSKKYEAQEWAVPSAKDEMFWEEEYGDRKKKRNADSTAETTVESNQEEQQRQQEHEEEKEEGEEDEEDNVEDKYRIPATTTTTSIIENEDNLSDDYDEEDDIIIFECVICNKSFKSEKQMQSHEKSKKHIKMVKDVVRRMKKENKDMGLENSGEEEFVDAIENELDNLTV